MLRSENARDDEVVGEAGEGLAPVSIAAFAISLARVSFHTERRVGGHSDTCGWRVRVVVETGFFLFTETAKHETAR